MDLVFDAVDFSKRVKGMQLNSHGSFIQCYQLISSLMRIKYEYEY